MTAANKKRPWLLGTALALTLGTVGWVSQFDEGGAKANSASELQRTPRHDNVATAMSDGGTGMDAVTAPPQRYNDSSNDLFAAPVAPNPVAAVIAETAIAPVAPPLPFTYLGRMVDEGRETIFIASPQRNYLAHSGEVLENNYRIDNIGNGQVRFTYLPLNITQILEIGETQ